MNEIKELFYESDKFSTKFEKYFDVYELLFKKFKEKNITFVEVGVLNGGSLEIWKNYFGKNSRIIGIDINSECKKFEKDNIEIFIGDQSKNEFWEKFYREVGKVDILLDDGGHTNLQQISTVFNSVKNINDDGFIIVEDIHSSYMEQFGNPQKFSFINFSKRNIDDLNFKFPNFSNLKNSLNDYIYSIQYFESIVVYHINKKKSYMNSEIYNNENLPKEIDDIRFEKSLFNNLNKNKFIKKN